MMKQSYKEVKASAIIISIIGGLILLVNFIQKSGWAKTLLWMLLIYLMFVALLVIIGSIYKNHYFKKIVSFLFFPLGLIFAALLLILPFFALLIHLIFYFFIAFIIPELLYTTLNYFHLIDFVRPATSIYLKITLTVFISVLFNPLLRHAVYLISPSKLKTSEKLKPYELDKLTDYFLSTSNVRFVVYGIYFMVLLAVNCFGMQGNSFTSGVEVDKSILQSFVTFIAFDRALTLLKQLPFRPSELLNRIRESIFRKLTDIDEKTGL